jgi:hypothetical protein
VNYYTDKDNFCIGIPDRQTEDMIYLIKNNSIKTVDDAIADVKNKKKKDYIDVLRSTD